MSCWTVAWIHLSIAAITSFPCDGVGSAAVRTAADNSVKIHLFMIGPPVFLTL